MPIVEPQPITVTIPQLPEHFPYEQPDQLPPLPGWTWVKPETWVHLPNPVWIEFPLDVPRKVQLKLKVVVAANGFFELTIEPESVQDQEGAGVLVGAGTASI